MNYWWRPWGHIIWKIRMYRMMYQDYACNLQVLTITKTQIDNWSTHILYINNHVPIYSASSVFDVAVKGERQSGDLLKVLTDYRTLCENVLLCYFSLSFPLPGAFSFTVVWWNCCIWIWKRQGHLNQQCSQQYNSYHRHWRTPQV